MSPARIKPVKHDHRRAIWAIAEGALLWCYQCGAWTVNSAPGEWHRPTGHGGPNPALRPVPRRVRAKSARTGMSRRKASSQRRARRKKKA